MRWLRFSATKIAAAAPGARRNERLATAVRVRLGKAGGTDFVAARNLGIDFAVAGKPTSLIRMRVVKGRRRAARAALLRKNLWSKRKSKRLFNVNVRADAYNGAKVHVLGVKDLLGVWSLAAKRHDARQEGQGVGFTKPVRHWRLALRPAQMMVG